MTPGLNTDRKGHIHDTAMVHRLVETLLVLGSHVQAEVLQGAHEGQRVIHRGLCVLDRRRALIRTARHWATWQQKEQNTGKHHFHYARLYGPCMSFTNSHISEKCVDSVKLVPNMNFFFQYSTLNNLISYQTHIIKPCDVFSVE